MTIGKLWFSGYQYPGLLDALTAIGWDVQANEDQNWWLWCWGRDSEGDPNYRPKRTAEEFGKYMRERAAGADAIVIGKGMDSNRVANDQAPPFWHIRHDDLLALKQRGATIVLLDLDSPDSFGFMSNCGLISTADLYGTCCIEVADIAKRWTAGKVQEFWPAWDQSLRKPHDPTSKRDVDLVMVGSPYTAPNAQFGIPRRDVVQAAIDMGLNVEIFGPGLWITEEFGSHAFAPYYKGFAAWDDLHNVFARAKVTYNSFLRRGFRYMNDRPFIAAGGGSFLLMEEQLGIDQELREGEHVGYHKHRDIEHFKERLRWWIDNDTERVAAATAMQKLTLAEHTYASRAAALSETICDLVSQRRNTKKRCCR